MSEQPNEIAAPAPIGNEIQWEQPVTEQTPPPPAETPSAPQPASPETPAPAEAPTTPPDFTSATLENGQHEIRLATGQVYRGATPDEALGAVVRAQVEASRRISELNQQLQDRQQPQTPQQQQPATQIDPSAMALADLLAPAFGAQNGQQLIENYQRLQAAQGGMQQMAQQQQEQQEVGKFFAQTPDFPRTDANITRLGEAMDAMGLAFTAENARFTHYALKGQGAYEMPHPSATQPRADNGTFAARQNTMPLPPAASAPAPAPTAMDPWKMSDADFNAQYEQRRVQ